MHHRTLALALGLVTALIGTVALPALGEESPAPSPSPAASIEGTAPVTLADITLAVENTPLDPSGSLDPDLAIDALSGWSELLLPLLAEVAGDDPELLALLDASGAVGVLEGQLLAELAAQLEEPPDEGRIPMGFLSATREPAARTRVAPATEGAAPSGLDGVKIAKLSVIGKLIQDANARKMPAGSKIPPFQSKDSTKTGVNVTQELGTGALPGDEMVTGIEFEKDGVKLGGKVRMRLTGDQCPDADGKVSMEFSVQGDGAASEPSGSATFMDRFEGKATGTVNDAAFLTGITYEGTGSTRTAEPGHTAWAEATSSGRLSFDWQSDGTPKAIGQDEGSGVTFSRRSSQATRADTERAVQNGLQVERFVIATMVIWQVFWRDNYCVKIKADIPATSQPSEQHGFDVHVVHKDGSELDAPVDATLSGPKALDPLRIEHSPGQLTYTAGDKDGDTGTIELVSTSRRGIGKLKKTVKVEEKRSYQPTSIPGVRTWTGACIDALDRGPIVLEWKDVTPGRTTKGIFTLEPSSETEGTLTAVLTGKGPDFSLKSRQAGTYRIEVSGTDDDGSPSELLVVHSMKGSGRFCAGGSCHTTKYPLSEGTIPLDVLSGKCPVAP